MSFRIFFFILFFWIGFLFLDLPWPHADDVFYGGTPVEYAQTGHLGNRMAIGLLSLSKTYYYPPFQPIVCGTWLRLVGINTRGLLSFQALCGALCSYGLWLFFVRYELKVSAYVFTLIALFGRFLTAACHPSAFALVLLIWGLLGIHQTSWKWRFLGLLLLAASIFTLPYFLFFVIPFGLWAFYSPYLNEGEEITWGSWIFCGIIATALNLSLFLVAIQFEWREWIKGYWTLIQLVPTPINIHGLGGGMMTLFYFLKSQTNAFFALLGGVISGVLCIIFAPPRTKLFSLAFLVSFFLMMYFYSVSFFFLMPWVSLSFIFVTWLTIEPIESPLLKKLAWISVVGVFIMMMAPLMVQIVAQKKQLTSEEISKIKSYASLSNQRLVIDSVVWRYVFDSQAPPHCVGITFMIQPRYNFFATPTTIQEKNPDDLWIVSKEYLQVMIPDTGILFEPLVVSGKPLYAIPKWKDEIIILK
ncbi:MAG: hypothetical protein V4507_16420 [Verrucomicrobiota bacterium]